MEKVPGGLVLGGRLGLRLGVRHLHGERVGARRLGPAVDQAGLLLQPETGGQLDPLVSVQLYGGFPPCAARVSE